MIARKNTMEEYKSKIEYINQVLYYIEYAKNCNFEDPLEFIRECIESDKGVFENVVDKLSSLNK